jgi:2-polyprenyl-3-methyl-5-hydroxy-6-metoxy-1,4-benzoquinol methylase
MQASELKLAGALGRATPPALVVIGGGTDAPTTRWPRECSARALRSLPPGRHGLLIGCADARLLAEHRRANPGVRWSGFDDRAEVLDAARPHLDEATIGPLDDASSLGDGQAYDLIVLDDVIQRMRHPLACLRHLAALATPHATLVLGFDNLSQLNMMTRIVEGDLSPSDAGPMTPGTLHQFSASSLYKLLLDAGWMPELKDHSLNTVDSEAVASAAVAMADALNIPRATVKRTLRMDRMIVEARRLFDAAPASGSAESQQASFTVVVPTTRENQLRLNVELSPGLREVQARIVSYRKAESPAQALEQSIQHCNSDWVLLCHQDVYFPSGFGLRLNALLADIPPDERAKTLIGFAGMAVKAEADGYREAGFVIDRLERFDHEASQRAMSVDEFAIVVSRDTVHRIDPAFGWHLWATDLCLASICEHKQFARIVRTPVFHNSLNDFQLPASFMDSVERLRAKYPEFDPITTLFGPLDAHFVSQRGGRPS